jgi:hypothetical protein
LIFDPEAMSGDALNLSQFNEIFGCFEIESESCIRKKIKRKCHEGFYTDSISASNRCICWRYLLGLIPHHRNLWVQILRESTVTYAALKKDIFPSFFTNVGFDPLSDSNPDTIRYSRIIKRIVFLLKLIYISVIANTPKRALPDNDFMLA